MDKNRVYFVGFSNGGQMCAKLSIQMSDKIAAIFESASSFSFDTTFIPIRKLPILFQIRNSDYGPGGSGLELLLANLQVALKTPGFKPHTISQTLIKSFDLNPN